MSVAYTFGIYFIMLIPQDAKSCDESYVSFSTKTPYRFAQNLDITVKRPHERCQAVQLNMVFRHGTRFPSTNDVLKINKMLDIIKGYTDLNRNLEHHIKNKLGLNLKFPFTELDDKLLTEEGDKELYNLGVRFRQRFPELFEKPFSVNELKFASTCKERSSRSANAFAIGLLEGQGDVGKCRVQPVALQIKPCANDEILRYFDLCDKYQQHVENNETADIELNKFMDGPNVAQVIEKVKKKLQLENDTKLSSNDIKSMYLSCAYNVGILNSALGSDWCQLFETEDFNVMEYGLDLKAFYKRSAAYKITYESSCPLLRDIFHSIQAKAGRQIDYKPLKGIFRSSHAETLVPLYALMRLLLDEEHLMANNFEQMQERKFRGSKIAPFGGNIAFVLYKCPNNVYKIQLYNNEKLLKLPCCNSETDCPLDIFERCYQKIIDGCDFHEMCKTNETSKHDEF